MFLIAANPAPTFNDPTKYSKEFQEFTRACLIKTPQKRASSSDLLQVNLVVSQSH
jgi:serine/threonine protein kinase